MSGKKAKAKRRALAGKRSIVKTAPRTLELEPPPKALVKLDLACGQNIKEGFEGVDLPGTPGVKHEVNLMKFPWPWADSSIDELHCSHFVEHLPMLMVDDFGNVVWPTDPGYYKARDLFFRFFDEVHRILVPNGEITVVVPSCRSNRGFQDPTHRRFFPAEAFLYLHLGWRKANKLEHYNVQCDFDGPINPGIYMHHAKMLELKHDEVRAEIIDRQWNIVGDWHAKLRAIKPAGSALPPPEAAPASSPG